MKENSQQVEDTQKKRVRVLIVAPSLTILGGQAVQARYLFEHLTREPLIDVSFLPHNPRLPRMLRVLQSIKYVRTLVTSAVYCLALMIKVPRHDIIHIFSASYFSFLLAPTPALLIAKLFGKKALLNYRSGEAEDHLNCWPRTAIPMIRLADELVVPSQYLVDVFAKFGFNARAISNIVDQRSFRFRERRPLLPYFLSNRNLYPLYNVACVLRAFEIIQRKCRDARLTIAGDGSERASLEALSRDLKLKNVEFRGLVAPENMGELYNQSHIFLNGSNIDNMPGSILEAFACGMPVITTDAGGIRWIVEHERTGFLVRKNDHEAMASAALNLLQVPGLADSIAKNAHLEGSAFTWAAVRKKWIGLYLRLAGETQILESPTHRLDGSDEDSQIDSESPEGIRERHIV